VSIEPVPVRRGVETPANRGAGVLAATGRKAMAAIKDVERPDYLYIGGEAEVLQRTLDHYRATLLWKCEALDEEQLRQRSVTPSELSLFELLRHLTDAERYWFQVCVGGRDLPRSFEPGSAPIEDVLAHYLEACEESRQITAAVPLDHVAFSGVYGQKVSHRFVLVHMIGEYARHCGHADLLRESIDGATGE
jgi:uncharacterized damage-inducible protein DinB